jgi:hypothetical protein
MVPKGSVPCLQESFADPYPEPGHSNPYHPILSKIHLNIIFPPMSSSS